MIEEKSVTLRIADLTVRVEGPFHYDEEWLPNCGDYLCEDDKPDCVLRVSAGNLAKMQENHPDIPKAELEFVAVHTAIANRLSYSERIVFHGAVITCRKKGILFAAPSGTGKSTQIALWKKYLGADVDIVNGDKPILHIEQDRVTAYGTPWCGKERWQKNRSTVLSAICFLERGEIPTITRMKPEDCVDRLIRQFYLPLEDTEASARTMECADLLARTVPMYLLTCDMTENSVRCAYEEIMGEPYPGHGL